jgi:hypothetical protein
MSNPDKEPQEHCEGLEWISGENTYVTEANHVKRSKQSLIATLNDKGRCSLANSYEVINL